MLCRIPDVMANFNRDVYRIGKEIAAHISKGSVSSLPPAAHHRRKEVAQMSLSLREGVDGPAAPPRTTTPCSSICSIL